MNAGYKRAGFSLIEMLAVVLVIVLLTSVVSLNVGSGGEDLKREQIARRLAAMMGEAQVEAEFSGADHGLYFELTGSLQERRFRGSWLRRYDQGWAETKGNQALMESVTFPEATEIFLTLSSDPDVEITSRPLDLRPEPHIIFYAGGEVTEGTIEWTDAKSGELLYLMEWDLFGRVVLLAGGEEASRLEFP